MQIERKSYQAAEVKVVGDEGVIEAIVSVFSNVDAAEETVDPGFFAKSLARKLPKGVWSHDWRQPVAKTLEARELLAGDPLLPPKLKGLGGLYIKGQFNLDTQRGREAFSDIKFGIVDEFSIGYAVTQDRYDAKRVRHLVDGELFEWSPVLVGCNPDTALLSAKSAAPAPDHGGAGDGPADRKAEPKAELKAAFGSYEDLMDRLYDAVVASMGNPDPFDYYCGYAYVVATYPDHVVVRRSGDPDATYWRVDYTLDDAGNPVLGEQQEVAQIYVPAAKSRLGIPAVDGAKALAERAIGARDAATKAGRTISAANAEQLGSVLAHLKEATASVEALLALAAPSPSGVAAAKTRKLRLLALGMQLDDFRAA